MYNKRILLQNERWIDPFHLDQKASQQSHYVSVIAWKHE